MTEYLSLVFLYNRASYKKILLVLGVIPLSFLVIFLLRIGDPYEAGSEMLMERAFGGVWAVIIFIAVNLLGLMSVANSFAGFILSYCLFLLSCRDSDTLGPCDSVLICDRKGGVDYGGSCRDRY